MLHPECPAACYRFPRTAARPGPASCGRSCHTPAMPTSNAASGRNSSRSTRRISSTTSGAARPDDPFGPDSVGLFAKFVPPTIANGKVFVATYGDHENPPGPTRYFEGQNPALAGSSPQNFYVAVYGLRP